MAPRVEVLLAGADTGPSTCIEQGRRTSRRGFTHAPLYVRFWRHVERSEHGCWTWTATRARFGYGQIASGGRGGHMLRAHRVSWELHNGPIPDGLWVLHKCDNPACVRPDHLFLGTHADNMRDCIAKGRHRGATHRETYLGERNGRSKLTADQVRELRLRRNDGESMRALARRFGVSKPSVQAIVRRDHWRHVP